MSSQIDSSIPVLTEVIAPAIKKADIPPIKHEKREETPLPVLDTDLSSNIKIEAEIPATQKDHKPEAQMDVEEWKHLENTLKENILKQVLARIDFVLEHKIRDSLAEILQVSVDKLASDIQLGLKNSLEDVVTRAVTQEIAKAKSNNNYNNN